MQPEWFRAGTTVPRTVLLGLRLQPYTIGHDILLRSLDSQVLEGSLHDATLEELLVAAFVCSQSFKEAKKMLHRPRRLKWFGRAWRLFLPRDIDLVEQLAIFRAHVGEWTWMPDLARQVGGWPLAAPDSIGLLAGLMHSFHWAEEKALDCSFAWANSLLSAHLEQQGKLVIAENNTEFGELFKTLEEAKQKGETAWDF